MPALDDGPGPPAGEVKDGDNRHSSPDDDSGSGDNDTAISDDDSVRHDTTISDDDTTISDDDSVRHDTTGGGNDNDSYTSSGGNVESPFFDREPIDDDRAAALLSRGEVKLRGRMPYSSNATFLVDVEHDGLRAQAIYKPVRGERPLWDFPTGLAHREAGAFLVSRALGWQLVPPTVVRDDLVFHTGSLQLFVPARFEEHYFTLVGEPRHRLALQRICALDVVINNTDRKSGHCLLGNDDNIWAIDNGLSFHHEFKLRTVIWDFAGEEIPRDLERELRVLVQAGPPQAVAATLTPLERAAMQTRTEALVSAGHFPVDDHNHRWPWPLV